MKNALQAQLLKAGLVDKKKAKKLNKQVAHAKRIGDESTEEAKRAVAEAKAKKLAKDQQLNQERQKAVQMINQHQIVDTQGEIEYKFVDGTKVKKLYLTDKFYQQMVAGHLVIAKLAEDDYALLPYPLANRINDKMEGFIINTADKAEETLDEDDPYAEYVIPDDLMW